MNSSNELLQSATLRDEGIIRADKCDKEIDDLFKRIDNDQSEYDKQVLTLSSGFLAVSLAFIKDVVPLKDAGYLSLLYVSFVLLGLCVISVLLSYQFSISGQLKAKAYWESEKNNPGGRAFPYGHAECAKWWNRLSGLLFGFGISFTVLFVILNIQSEAKMARTTDGAYIKTPTNNNGEERGSLVKAPAKPAQAQPNSNGSNQPKKP